MRLPKRGSIVHKVTSSLFDALTDSGDTAASEVSKRPGAVKTALAATGGAVAVVAGSAVVSSMRRRGDAGDDA